MPTYEYACSGPAHHHFERFQRFSEPPVQECPECGASVRRVIFPVGVVFKGPGFYKTDSRPTPEALEERSAAGKDDGEGKGSGDGKGVTDSDGKAAGKQAKAATDDKAEAAPSPAKAETSPAASASEE